MNETQTPLISLHVVLSVMNVFEFSIFHFAKTIDILNEENDFDKALGIHSTFLLKLYLS